jgi:hypothetical protein
LLIAGGDLETTDVVQAAVERQREGRTSPRRDPVLLAVVNGVPADEEMSILGRARLASLQCNQAATETLLSASDADRRVAGYWEVAIRASAISGTPDDRAISVYELLTGRSVSADAMTVTLNPLHQSDDPVRFGLDLWGYRRGPIAWPVYEPLLPDPAAGGTRWLLDPVQAGRAAGVATCD